MNTHSGVLFSNFNLFFANVSATLAKYNLRWLDPADEQNTGMTLILLWFDLQILYFFSKWKLQQTTCQLYKDLSVVTEWLQVFVK